MSSTSGARRLAAGRRNLDDAIAVALLPTPEAKLSDSGPDYARAARGASGGDDLTTTVFKVLPTPRSSDAEKGSPNQHGSSGDLMLTSAVHSLLPTPTSRDWKDTGDFEPHPDKVKLPHTVAVLPAGDRWGEYAAAIERQEQAFGTPAPDPVEPGPRGGLRLAPRFVEWLMVWVAGWVTAVPGLTRNEQLKILGNGVVTPQAEVALDDLVGLALDDTCEQTRLV